MECICGAYMSKVKYDEFPDEDCWHCPICDIDIVIEDGKRIIIA